jgi:hypothetical protein
MSTRIDQFLFLNIVKQCYEADKAEKEWFRIYKTQSENDKNLYKFFYSKIVEIVDKNEILDQWYSVVENKEEYERWERLYRDKIRLDRMFIDVESFLMMFSHHR